MTPVCVSARQAGERWPGVRNGSDLESFASVFREHPLFQALEAPHRQLHEIATRLIGEVQRGAGLADIATGLQSLTARSVELVGLLQALDDDGMAQSSRLKCCVEQQAAA